MSRFLIILCLLLVSATSFAADEKVGQSDSASSNELDQQLQLLKQDVLELSSELSRIEQQLLFPSGTQINVFISLARHTNFVLESVRLEVDEKTLTNYIYTSAELQALNNGGIQKLYTGNVVTGSHALALNFVGRNEAGERVDRTVSHQFDKKSKTIYIEAQLMLSADGVDVMFTDQ